MGLSKTAFIVTLCAIALLFPAVSAVAMEPVDGAWKPLKKKVIDVSWSNPTVDYLEKNIDRMEKEAPLDGLVVRFLAKGKTKDGKDFTVGSNCLMGKTPIKYEWFMDTIVKYKSIPFKKFTDNFFYAVVSPGNMDWFSDSDWEAVCNNFGIASKIAKEVGMRGILFDPEEYAEKFWDYSTVKGDHSFAECVKIARQRGQQFGNAIFKEYPDIKIFCLSLLSLESGRSLIHSFYNGVYDVMPPTAIMIEGCEALGYAAKRPGDYDDMRLNMDRGLLPLVASSNYSKYRSQTQLAPAFYMDGIFVIKDGNYWHDVLKPEIDTFPPTEFLRKNLMYALKISDEYVWIYGECASWWSNSEHPRAQQTWEQIIPGVTGAIKQATDPYNLDFSKKINLIKNPKCETEIQGWGFWKKAKSKGQYLEKDGTVQMDGVTSGCINQSVPVKTQAFYLVSASAKFLTKTESGDCYIYIAYQDKDWHWNNRSSYRTVYFPEAVKEKWTKVEFVVYVPERSPNMSIQLSASNLKPGEVIAFDDIKLFKL